MHVPANPFRRNSCPANAANTKNGNTRNGAQRPAAASQDAANSGADLAAYNVSYYSAGSLEAGSDSVTATPYHDGYSAKSSKAAEVYFSGDQLKTPVVVADPKSLSFSGSDGSDRPCLCLECRGEPPRGTWWEGAVNLTVCVIGTGVLGMYCGRPLYIYSFPFLRTGTVAYVGQALCRQLRAECARALCLPAAILAAVRT